MNGTEQVEYETRVRVRYGVIAVAAGLLLVVQALIQLSGPHTNVDELTLDLLTAHRRFPLDLIGAIVDAIALGALAVTLNWLHSIARARNPQNRDFIRWLAIVGAGLSGVMAVAYAIVIAIKANQFATTGNQTYVEADRLTTGGLIVILPLLAQLGSLLLTGGFIWISLNAMRVGLLSRFMGYVGVFAGVLVLFPIGSPVPVVQGFWLVSVGMIFIGRWFQGIPPAWASGTAVPWPPMGQPRQSTAVAGAPGRGARGRRAPEPATATVGPPAAVADSDGATGGRTRASTPKRKRKRRT